MVEHEAGVAGAGRFLCAGRVLIAPSLIRTNRTYRKRELQIVTVSINAPDEKKTRKMVPAFLDEQHAINTNLLWGTNDAAEAVSAFGTGWNGGVPYTVLIGSNGEVLYRDHGGFDPLQVKRAILKNLPDDSIRRATCILEQFVLAQAAFFSRMALRGR